MITLAAWIVSGFYNSSNQSNTLTVQDKDMIVTLIFDRKKIDQGVRQAPLPR
jgi:hypothetical protein